MANITAAKAKLNCLIKRSKNLEKNLILSGAVAVDDQLCFDTVHDLSADADA